MVHVWQRVDDVPAAFAEFLEERRPASIALSGGSTARRCYEATAALGLDWSRTAFWFGDERWVPVTDPDSNEALARAAWLDAASPLAVHSLAGAAPGATAGGDGIGRAAETYDAALRAAPPIDLVHLGLGPDGHTASLFPGAGALGEHDALVIATGDDAHPHPRLTFTYAAIAAARTVVVTVAGAEKRAALAGVRAGDRDLPATRVDAPEVIWMFDAGASPAPVI